VVLFFFPGLNNSIDFADSVVNELRMPKAVDIGIVWRDLDSRGFGEVRGQEFGTSEDERAERIKDVLQSMPAAKPPGSDTRRSGAVSARVSGAR
jgi:preprotein translocase subunit SecF